MELVIFLMGSSIGMIIIYVFMRGVVKELAGDIKVYEDMCEILQLKVEKYQDKLLKILKLIEKNDSVILKNYNLELLKIINGGDKDDK